MDEIDSQLLEIRKKQNKCPHTCWKCPSCSLYKDHYQTKEQEYIKTLEQKIAEYEATLTSLGFLYSHFKTTSENGIIRTTIDESCITEEIEIRHLHSEGECLL